MKPSIAVAVSGGVDSMVAAYLLKQSGFPIFAVHFVTGYEPAGSPVAAVADQLGIDLHFVDLVAVFRSKVLRYFSDTYIAGKTPNPCIVCNSVVKFGILREHARTLGADRFATGHYARTLLDTNEQVHLIKGVDPRKDQSYFLALLTRDQLAGTCFPLGTMRKSDVKKLAVREGLRPTAHKESQDVCFIHGREYGEFLEEHMGLEPQPGDIVDREGHVIGKHGGLHLFTVGQRRGINCPAAEPYYVLSLDRLNRRLIVGRKEDTLKSECRVEKINWIQPPPTRPLRIHARLRYRHKAATAELHPLPNDRAVVRFDAPQSAVTPGQGAVFYDADEVLGGGFIE